MLLIYIILIIITLFISISIVYFLSPRLSPVPYFPSNGKDIEMIVEEILQKSDVRSQTSGKYSEFGILDTEFSSTIIDLGAGTGTVIFPAAQKAYEKNLNIKFVAVEIHPLLVLIMQVKRLFHPNRKNMVILRQDMFKVNYKEILNTEYRIRNTIYLYVGPHFMTEFKKGFRKLPKKTRIISYMYDIPGWKKKLVSKKDGVHPLFTYFFQ